MQYGNLTVSQRSTFDLKQTNSIRKPSFAVWIEGFGDTTRHVIDIDSEVALESPLGRGNLHIGQAILVVSNENGYFYDNGKSNIKSNAHVKIWTGFDNLNIPIFTGVVHSVKPIGTTNMVTLNCHDYMGLTASVIVKDSQDPNNTAKLMIENFCDQIGVQANVPSTSETTEIYSDPKFDEQSMLSALEEICESIFYVAYFDEAGTLQVAEREYSNPVEWKFDDDSIIDCGRLIDTEIINDVFIEYRENFYVGWCDQPSINEYGTRNRSLRLLLLNSTLVSEMVHGSTSETLDHDLEAFKFISAGDASSIDCLQIKMKQSDAHGNMVVKVHSDNGGVPGALLGTSQSKASANLYTDFAWETFYFTDPVTISPSTIYWVVIDTTPVSSGTVYVQISAATASATHACYSEGAWHTENDKQVLHTISRSLNARRLAEDLIRFYKQPHERIHVIAPAVPQLQLLDEVRVDIEHMQIFGHFVCEGRRHVLTPEGYMTVDILRKKN